MSRKNRKFTLYHWLLILIICGYSTGCAPSSPTPIVQTETDTPTAVLSPTTPRPAPISTPVPPPTTPVPPTGAGLPTMPPTATHTPTAIPSTATPAPTATFTAVPATPTLLPVPFTPTPPTPSPATYVRQLVIIPTNPETLIALIDDGRLLRSTDGGNNWVTLYTRRKTSWSWAVGADYNPPHSLYLLTEQGLYRSLDYGRQF